MSSVRYPSVPWPKMAQSSATMASSIQCDRGSSMRLQGSHSRLLVQFKSLLVHMLRENSHLTRFQLTRRYTRSIVGVPSSLMPDKLLDVHVQLATRCTPCHKPHDRTPRTLRPSELPEGTRVYVNYKSSLSMMSQSDGSTPSLYVLRGTPCVSAGPAAVPSCKYRMNTCAKCVQTSLPPS